MKASAPEKIYINGFSCFAEEPVKDSVEYIRADTFIEKACEWLRENKDKYLYNTGSKGEYIPTCSGKMIDDFKKYVKGE